MGSPLDCRIYLFIQQLFPELGGRGLSGPVWDAGELIEESFVGCLRERHGCGGFSFKFYLCIYLFIYFLRQDFVDQADFKMTV